MKKNEINTIANVIGGKMLKKLHLRFLLILLVIIIPLLIVFIYRIKTGKLQETIAKLTIPKNSAIIESEENNSDKDVIVVILNENYKEKETKEPIVVILNERKKETTQEAVIADNRIENTEMKQQNEENEEREENNTSYNENENQSEAETNNSVNNFYKPYYIKVNNSANVVTVYMADENGNYTLPHKAFLCSTGTATPTSGEYKLDYKYRWLGLFGNVYGQYCTRIVGNILFHSVPYLEKENNGSLEYWEYDKLRRSSIYGMHKVNSRRS